MGICAILILVCLVARPTTCCWRFKLQADVVFWCILFAVAGPFQESKAKDSAKGAVDSMASQASVGNDSEIMDLLYDIVMIPVCLMVIDGVFVLLLFVLSHDPTLS